MSDIYELVSGDTAPQIKATITRFDDGSVVNMSGATVRLYFRKKGTTSVLFTLTAAATADLANGIAVFSFNSTDLENRAAGNYEGEIEITHSDGKKETIFEILNFVVRSDFN
tara:strand:+ start:1432 stop:1767 length:336 start_codon:yes stop_codon:yes gene_type:complete